MLNLNNKKNIYKFLGILGFIPFLFFLFLSFLDQSNSVEYLKATSFYLSIVISFIGASYWGIALNLKTKNITLSIFSVIPAILVSLLHILNIYLFLKLLAGILFLNIIFFYERSYFKDYIPIWYIELRKKLNFLVTFSVLIIILTTFNYKDYF